MFELSITDNYSRSVDDEKGGVGEGQSEEKHREKFRRGNAKSVTSAECPPTALPSFRPPCDSRFFGIKSIAAMLWPVVVIGEEFAEVSHASELS
ncbi:hypothetical protein PoB_006517400 [Plakobranchus ocellatus]|uniref:Uncharacterized protein n=1 Tax=Plakobranchus ocellatus TaxID=259542 RepID=A0AAV4D3F2_9GAST|nr:hypothetical protein PoB_006517400 [Plakobranchus ocellatus]